MARYLVQAPLDSLPEDRKASVAKRRLRLQPAHKRGGLGSGASEPERLHVDVTRPASHGAHTTHPRYGSGVRTYQGYRGPMIRTPGTGPAA